MVKKDVLARAQSPLDPRVLAWETLLQRLERYSAKNGVPILMVHDEGEGEMVRKMARKARRAGTAGSRLGTGILKRPLTLLLDDPVERRSHESYFIQFADLDAYAAFRAVYAPPPRPQGVQIVPSTMWGELGASRLAAVNMYSGGPTGIVIR